MADSHHLPLLKRSFLMMRFLLPSVLPGKSFPVPTKKESSKKSENRSPASVMPRSSVSYVNRNGMLLLLPGLSQNTSVVKTSTLAAVL